MNTCRVCGAPLGAPIYSAAAPSMTSLAHFMNLPTQVYACVACGHGQASDLPDAAEFYDHGYRISLSSDDYDQLCSFVDGRPVYRTDLQADLVLSKTDIPEGARVLDFGAGKATTLQKVAARRPDIEPHVFDMSSDYEPYWQAWIRPDRTATYKIPDAWEGTFNLVTAHFVLEHVLHPAEVLARLHRLLRRDGTLFMSVPNPLENAGDLIAIDHVNHFTDVSLRRALDTAGFDVQSIDSAAFTGAFIVVARPKSAGAATGASFSTPDIKQAVARLNEIGKFWVGADRKLRETAAARRGRKCAIYGAGVYGLYVYSRVAALTDVRCFIDRNPHVRMAQDMACPVLAVAELPEDVDIVFAGLNPRNARAIVSNIDEWSGRRLEIVYLD